MSYTLRDLPQEERPRERLKKYGVENLSLQELLAIVIEKGRRGKNVLTLAQELLARFGNLQKIKEASILELQKVEGIGFATACKIKAALALGERTLNTKEKPEIKITKPVQVFKLLKPELSKKKKEFFKIICLDTRSKVVAVETISVGSLNASLAHPREIFYSAIKNTAASFIIVHNHPSGDPTPSQDDIEITKKLKKLSEMLKIPLVDHVIIGSKDYYSFKENGLL